MRNRTNGLVTNDIHVVYSNAHIRRFPRETRRVSVVNHRAVQNAVLATNVILYYIFTGIKAKINGVDGVR